MFLKKKKGGFLVNKQEEKIYLAIYKGSGQWNLLRCENLREAIDLVLDKPISKEKWKILKVIEVMIKE